MNTKFGKSMSRAALSVAMLATIGGLSGCGDDDNKPAPTPSPTPTMTPTPSPTAASYDVTPCLNQTIPGTPFTVAQAVVPDTLTLDLSAPSGFPNGRQLSDPVIDVTLAVVFLDLGKNAPDTLAKLPLNPPANDKSFDDMFPYLAGPHGSPPLADTSGTNFNFRMDPASAYERVDRMGMPAVSTALIGSDQKNAYNDADPADDAAGQFVPELTKQLTGLTNALADDLVAAGLTPCAKPATS